MARREFGEATLLCVVHRLTTIIDYDRILVMSNGKAVEYGPPAERLQKEKGPPVDLVSALGPEAEADLRRHLGATPKGGGRRVTVVLYPSPQSTL